MMITRKSTKNAIQLFAWTAIIWYVATTNFSTPQRSFSTPPVQTRSIPYGNIPTLTGGQEDAESNVTVLTEAFVSIVTTPAPAKPPFQWDENKIYPPDNDGQAQLDVHMDRDHCSSTGDPIPKDWILEQKRADASIERVLKAPQPTGEFRGFVKACMKWDDGYFWPDYWKQFGNCSGEDYCDIPCGDVQCRYSWTQHNWGDCTAVVMHHTLQSFVTESAHLRRVLLTTEPLYRIAQYLESSQNVDIFAHWHRSAHVWVASHNNQFSPEGEPEFAKEMNFGHLACPIKSHVANRTSLDRRIALAVFNQGNCATNGGYRETYVSDLRKYIHVDAYGGCLRNKNRPNPQPWPWQKEMELRGNYKFVLAFENEQSPDWVTEKVYHALLSGAVPVYHGANTIDDFLPCSHCIIRAFDFPSAKELAAYLIELDQDNDKYMAYHAWRNAPMMVPRMMQASKSFLYCGICTAVADDIEGKLPQIAWRNGVFEPRPESPRKPVPPNYYPQKA